MSAIAPNAPSQTFAPAASLDSLSVSSEELATNAMQPTVLHACPLPTVAALAMVVSLPLEESAFPAT